MAKALKTERSNHYLICSFITVSAAFLMANHGYSGALTGATEQKEELDDNAVLEWANNKATVEVADKASELRTYRHTSTLYQRGKPGEQSIIQYKENSDQMHLRSGSLMLDALFALALEETNQNSVEAIRDPGFNYGNEIDCKCFQTGEKWRYVWTRDSAYAINLGLAQVDPVRSMNSLLFKVSGFRAPGFEERIEVVQDTGSGGSWPISTDRVSWAMAADSTLHFLSGEKRQAFLERSYEALKNTLETDRVGAYDSIDRLYKGEQSFLDWREQSYATWTKEDTVHIGTSKALSTNINHYLALVSTSKMATELGHAEEAEKFGQWAADLKEAIRKKFWLPKFGMYSSITAAERNGATLAKFDLLGLSLAILSGVADEAQGYESLSSYPNSQRGAPVLWPQQPLIPIYHNRAIWPFVTAYGLKAAKKVKHARFAAHNIHMMIGAAATNISNMENLEFLTGHPYFHDNEFSGPLVNSRRQLWSVAGYLSSILDILIGLEMTREGLTVAPFIPAGTMKEFLGNSSELVLENYRVKGKELRISIDLPEAQLFATDQGYFTAKEVSLNGKLHDGPIDIDALKVDEVNKVEVSLLYVTHPIAEGDPLTTIAVRDPSKLDETEWKQIWSPKEPKIEYVELARLGGVEISLSRNDERKTLFNIYRNGNLIAEGITDTSFQDRNVDTNSPACYAAEQYYVGYNNISHHSKPICLKRLDDTISIRVNDSRLKSTGDTKILWKNGRYYYSNWGSRNQVITASNFGTRVDGDYGIQVTYANAHNSVNLGITTSNKRIEIFEAGSDIKVGEGIVTMPHLPDWSTLGNSSTVRAKLKAGKRYYIKVSDYMNMTYLTHFEAYTAGAGGNHGYLNKADIFGIEITRVASK